MYQRNQEHSDNCAKMRDFLKKVKDKNFNFKTVINPDHRLVMSKEEGSFYDATLTNLAVEASLISIAKGQPLIYDCGTTGCVYGYSPAVFPSLVWNGSDVERRSNGGSGIEHFAGLLGMNWYYFEPNSWPYRGVTKKDCIAMLNYFAQEEVEINPLQDRSDGLSIEMREVIKFRESV